MLDGGNEELGRKPTSVRGIHFGLRFPAKYFAPKSRSITDCITVGIPAWMRLPHSSGPQRKLAWILQRDLFDLETQKSRHQRFPKLAHVSLALPHTHVRIANHTPGAECKRHKIRCEFRSGETNCTKCIRSGIKCVVNDFSQKFVDDDGMCVHRNTR